MSNRKHLKQTHISQFLLIIIIVVLVNFIAQFTLFRIDLTAEKRHTISKASKEILKELDDVYYFKIYLDGENLPAGFRKLQSSIKDLLDEFRVYAGENIEYQFIDPFESPDIATRGEIGRQLISKGLQPSNVEEVDRKGGTSEKLLFTGAIVSYRDQEEAVEFLKSNIAFSGDQNVNHSINLLEYEIIRTMVKLKTVFKKRIAIIDGNGELNKIELADLEATLKEYYEVERIVIDGQLNALDFFDCILVAAPSLPYTEKDKYIIDQFIMKGGKSVWCLNGVNANMDSLAMQSSMIAMINKTNLDDQLFRYGARVNPNLILDMNCGGLKINTSPVGAQARFRLFPWVYFPLLYPNSDHLIGKNIDLVKSEFASTIDTIGGNPNVKKEVLLFTSQRSKSINAPALIQLDIINEVLEERNFPESFLTTAVLLEGNFTSLYKNRLGPEFLESNQIQFLEESKKTSMIICSDGDIIRNQYRIMDKPIPFALGYDRHTDMTFHGNKDFILNVFSYLLDEDQLIEIRNKEISLRLLNKSKIISEEKKWQLINTLIPVIFVILVGIFIHFKRKNKYAKGPSTKTRSLNPETNK